ITDAYAKYIKDPNIWGSAGDHNWVEQLLALRSTSVLIENQARAGATSSSLLTASVHSTTLGQDTLLSTLVHNDLVDYGVLIIGANDIQSYLANLTAGRSTDATPFVNQLVANVATVLDRVQAAGHVALVVSNVPDLSHTPRLQA